MQRSSRPVVLLALAAVAFACSDEKPSVGEGAATIRLSPTAVQATAGIDAVRLVDRDTTAPVAIPSRTSVTLQLAHEVQVRRVKVHGAVSLKVAALGLDEMGEASAAGWQAANAKRPFMASQITLVLTPLAADARLDEIEVWGAGGNLAPRDPQALAVATAGDSAPVFENAWVLRASPASATLQPVGSGSGDACIRASFAGYDPRQARRAWLAFEANVPRGVALQRSLNGGAPRGGFWLGTTTDARTLLDEVDPEALKGNDVVLLCLPAEATGPVDVKGLRLLLALDDGTDFFDRDAQRRLGAAADGDPSTSAALSAGPQDSGLDRLVDVEHAEIRLASGQAKLHAWGVSDGKTWADKPGLELQAQANPLPLAGSASALRLDFAGQARADIPAANVAEIAITGSGVGPRVGSPRIVLTYPPIRMSNGTEIAERFGDRAFVAGWAESPAGRGKVLVQGAQVDTNGTFAVPLERDADATGGWTVTINAQFPDGSVVTRTVALDDDHEDELEEASTGQGLASSSQRFGRENETAWGKADASGGKAVLGTDVSIEVPAGALAAAASLGITRKSYEAVPELDAGMVNVTAPAHTAYRFLPKGQKFAVPVKIKLPYDPSLLPDGVAPEEIRTYYYDEDQEHWVALARDEVRRAASQVVSETTHFTFMINAVLVLPDHPGPVSFNPNSIKDLKAADPSAGIDLIEPPQANNEGTARVSFPFRLPRARGAYQPSLALAYDSNAGNGWTGVGWDVAVPSVTIDTRYGVPDYDGEERYLLQGEQMVPVDPAPYGTGTCLDGAHARKYVARVEKNFRQILRCGDDPAHYWFQMADKSGTLFVFGRSPNARLTSYLPRVVNPPVFPPVYDIGQWFLERVVDANGNLTEYGYQHDSLDATAEQGQNEDFRQVYLRSIRYSGKTTRGDAGAVEGGTSGPYLVELLHQPGIRSDEVISGRLGFKTVLRRRLGTITVSLLAGSPSGTIRSYQLKYEHGDFGKSRLTSVGALGADGSLFYTHTFEYQSVAPESASEVSAFSGPEAWTTGAADDLSGSNEISAGFHGFVGLGLGPLKMMGAVGVGFGYSQRKTTSQVAMLDVNGDGLPDRVYGDHVRLNQGAGTPGFSTQAPSGDPAVFMALQQGVAFISPVQDKFSGDRSLGVENGNSVDASLQVFGGPIALNFGGSYSIAKTGDFFADVNGDGLVDFVSGGQVYFNQPRRASCPGNTSSDQCCLASGFCFLQSYPVSALNDLGDSAPLVQNNAAIAQANQKLAENLTPEDAVLEWTVPFDGHVDVTGMLAYRNTPLTGGRHDGVRLSVYQYDPASTAVTLEPLAVYVKPPTDLTATPVTLPNVAVTRGQLLYFVLSTLSDYPMTLPDGTPSPIEEVNFAPVITYLGRSDAERSQQTPTGAELFRFDAAKDFSLAGEPPSSIVMPRDGKVQLTITTTKAPTSDTVRLCIQYWDPKSLPTVPPSCSSKDWFYRELKPESAQSRVQETLGELDVLMKGTFYVRVESDVAIDPRAITWAVQGQMTCVSDSSGNCRPPTDQERPYLSFQVQPYFPLHDDVIATSDRWAPSGAWLVPFVAPADGTITIKSSATHANTTTPIFFSVRTHDRQIFKVTGNHGTSGSSQVPVTVDYHLLAGEQVFFEAHSESGVAISSLNRSGLDDWGYPSWNLGCTFVSDKGKLTSCAAHERFTTDRRAEGFTGGNQPILAGGHHEWRFGAWQGKDGEPFQGWIYRSASGCGSWGCSFPTPTAPSSRPTGPGCALMSMPS